MGAVLPDDGGGKCFARSQYTKYRLTVNVSRRFATQEVEDWERLICCEGHEALSLHSARIHITYNVHLEQSSVSCGRDALHLNVYNLALNSSQTADHHASLPSHLSQCSRSLFEIEIVIKFSTFKNSRLSLAFVYVRQSILKMAPRPQRASFMRRHVSLSKVRVAKNMWQTSQYTTTMSDSPEKSSKSLIKWGGMKNDKVKWSSRAVLLPALFPHGISSSTARGVGRTASVE